MEHSKFIFQGRDLGFWKIQALWGCGGMDDISVKITENGELKEYVDHFHDAIKRVVKRYEYACFLLWDIELVFRETKKPIGKQRLKKLFSEAVLTSHSHGGFRDAVAIDFNSYWDRSKHHMNKEYRSKYKEDR